MRTKKPASLSGGKLTARRQGLKIAAFKKAKKFFKAKLMAEKEVSVEKDVQSRFVDSVSKNIMVNKDTENSIKKWLKDVEKAPVAKQIGIGASVGWVSGYLTLKVGKMAATAVGGSLLLLQIANHRGYVNVDWKRLSNDIQNNANEVQKRISGSSKGALDKLLDFARDNVYVAGGFTAGFFLGIASA